MYQRKHTWIEGGPRWAKSPAGLGETVTVQFPEFNGIDTVAGGGTGQALHPYGFLEDAPQYIPITQAPPSNSPASGAPCFSLAFPWVGTQAAGVCQPVVNVSSTIGIGITIVAIALAVYKVVAR